MTHILINQQTANETLSKITHYKSSGSAVRNVHVLCSLCPPPATIVVDNLPKTAYTFSNSRTWLRRQVL